MQINDLFGRAAAFETARLPDGTAAVLPAEHAAALYVNEQPAFRVVCTPELLPQLALGRLLTEGWITSAQEVEQAAVCAEGLKVNVYLNHRLTARSAAAQAVSSCCTDNVTLSSPVELPPLRTVPQMELQPEWLDTLAAAMSAGLPLYRATRAVHSCFVLRQGTILFACEDIGRHNALDKAAAGRPAGRMRALYQRPGARGHGAQGHPGGCSGTGEQEHAHDPIAGTGAGIRPAAGVRQEASANFSRMCKMMVTKQRKHGCLR